MPLPRWLILPFLATIPAACGSSSEAGTAFSVRDSAGVEIVESNVAAWGDESRWTVDSAPVLVIGQEEGEEPYMLDRIAGAVRLDDGGIVVADGSTRQLRLFDADGHFVTAGGRRGEGPGEFRTLTRIARCGADAVWAASFNRVSIWGTDLTYRREFPVPEDPMWPLVCFDGAGVIVKRDTPEVGEQNEGEIFGSSLDLSIRDSLGQNPQDFTRISLYSRVNVVDGRSTIGMVHPFGAVTVLAAQGPNVAIGTAQTLEVHTYDRDGNLLRIVRGPERDFRITDSLRSAYAAAELTGWPGEERRLLGLVGNPMPESYPAYTSLLVDRDGNIWARRFSVHGPGDSRWGIFATDGRFLGHTHLPGDLDVYEIGTDYVLGKARDSLGVEQVRMYRLRR